MSTEFNPYHKWLGIPLEEQPANHYRLLGVTLFEADADVIEAAADRQMAHVQRYKTGQYSALSQELLNELAAAKVCLLIKEKKAAYDQELKAGLPVKAQRSAPAPAAEVRLPRATPLIEPAKAPAPKKPPARKLSPVLLGGAGVAAIGLIVVVAMMAGSGEDPKPGPEPAPPPAIASSQAAMPQAGATNQPAKPVLAETPRLQLPEKLSVREGDQLATRVKVVGTSAAGLSYALAPGCPEGVELNSSTGELRWQPKEEQGPQDHQLTVRLIDADGKQLDEGVFEIAVQEVNQPPVMDAIKPTLNPSGVVTFQIQGRDPDLPATQLAYSLEDAPEGASVDPETGAFTWKPTSEQLGKRFAFKIRVTDDATPKLATLRLISIDIPANLPAPAVASAEPPMPAVPANPTTPEPPAVAQTSQLAPAKEKLPAPSSAARGEALVKIKDIFKEQYKGKKPEEKAALAKALMNASGDTEDAASRYVLLDEVISLATASGDVTLCWQAIDALTQNFAVDGVEMKTAALKKLSTLRIADAVHAVATKYVELIDEAAAADNYDAVIPLLTTALPAIQKTKDAALVTQFQNRGKDLRTMKKEFDGVQAAMAVLKATPDDPAANLTVGCYLSFAKDKLAEGLPLLAKCSSEKLAAAAKRDLAAPSSVEDQTAAGEAWWTVAESAKGVDKERYQQRAAYWYRQVLPQLTGLEKVKLEKRLETVPLAANAKPAFSPPPPISPAPISSVSSLPADLKNERKFVEAFLKANIGYLYVKLDTQRNTRVSNEAEIPQGNFFVQSVNSMNTVVTDQHLELFKSLKFIESCYLSSAQGVTDAGLVHLQGLTSLKRFSLYDSSVTDKGLSTLGKLPRLESIHVRGGNFTGAGLAALAALPQLTSVDVHSNLLNDDAIAAAARLPRLERLTISGMNVRGMGLSNLKSCVTLNSLNLDCGNLDDSQLAGLAGATALQNLTVQGNPSEAALAHVGKIPNLRYLHWHGTQIGPAGARSLASLRLLEQLELRDTTDETLKAIATLTQLRNLNVTTAGRLTDKGLAPLANMTSLTNLSLQNASGLIGNDGLTHLAKIPALQYLTLSGPSSINDAGLLAAFRNKPQLRNLSFYNSPITDAGAKALKAALPNSNISR